MASTVGALLEAKLAALERNAAVSLVKIPKTPPPAPPPGVKQVTGSTGSKGLGFRV
jgi:hypothetical protein